MSINNKNTSYMVPIKEGNTVIFYIYTGSFPILNEAWLQMWQYAKELQPNAAEKLERIKLQNEDVPDHQVPIPPYNYISNKKMSNTEKLEKIQNFIDKLQYNHTGVQFFDIRKERPLIGLMEVSKKIIEDSLPIKCLEAVILSIYLINEISGSNPSSENSASNIEKFTIGFKTNAKGNIHRHVVLGVYWNGLFGALGISRRSDLGYKKLKFKTLTDLLLEYIDCYAAYLHKVKRIRIGMPIANSNRSFESIPWNGCTINPNSIATNEWIKAVEKQSRCIRYNTYNANLAQNSLSLKNLTNSNSNQRTYIINHLEKQTKLNGKQRSKSQEQNVQMIESNGSDEQENNDTDDYFYNKYTSISYLNKIEDFLPRTAPLIGFNFSKKSRKNFENVTSFQLTSPKNSSTINQLTNINTNSGILSKRKKKSLRV